jgi:hypothetical protein
LDLKEKDIIAIRNATAISTHVDLSCIKFNGLKKIFKRRMLRFSNSFLSYPSSMEESSSVDIQAGSSESFFIALLQIITPISSSTNTTKLYHDLKTSLDEAIESGNFTMVLRQVSIASGSTAFKDANATSVIISGPTITTVSDSPSDTDPSSSSSDEDKSFPRWAIYATSIGGFGVLAVAGIIVYCFFFKSDGSSGTDTSYHYQVTASAPPAPEIAPLPTTTVEQPPRSLEEIQL